MDVHGGGHGWRSCFFNRRNYRCADANLHAQRRTTSAQNFAGRKINAARLLSASRPWARAAPSPAALTAAIELSAPRRVQARRMHVEILARSNKIQSHLIQTQHLKSPKPAPALLGPLDHDRSSARHSACTVLVMRIRMALLVRDSVADVRSSHGSSWRVGESTERRVALSDCAASALDQRLARWLTEALAHCRTDRSRSHCHISNAFRTSHPFITSLIQTWLASFVRQHNETAAATARSRQSRIQTPPPPLRRDLHSSCAG